MEFADSIPYSRDPRHPTVSWACRIQSSSSHHIPLASICLGLPSSTFPLCKFLSPVSADDLCMLYYSGHLSWRACKKGKSLCFNWAPCILDIGTRWMWVVSFTSRPLYPQGESTCLYVKCKSPTPIPILWSPCYRLNVNEIRL